MTISSEAAHPPPFHFSPRHQSWLRRAWAHRRIGALEHGAFGAWARTGTARSAWLGVGGGAARGGPCDMCRRGSGEGEWGGLARRVQVQRVCERGALAARSRSAAWWWWGLRRIRVEEGGGLRLRVEGAVGTARTGTARVGWCGRGGRAAGGAQGAFGPVRSGGVENPDRRSTRDACTSV